MIYVSRYVIANEEGPPPRPGVVRVEKSSGSWRFEATDDGARTRAKYTVLADPIAGVPRWVEDWAMRDMISKIFGALRERAQDPTYRK